MSYVWNEKKKIENRKYCRKVGQVGRQIRGPISHFKNFIEILLKGEFYLHSNDEATTFDSAG